MGMSAKQKQYCRDRIDGIANIKIQAIRDKYTTKAVELSNEEKMEMLYSASPPKLLKRAVLYGL